MFSFLNLETATVTSSICFTKASNCYGSVPWSVKGGTLLGVAPMAAALAFTEVVTVN